MGNIDYSVIIPAYNAASFIKRAVASISSQNYDSWEIIIVENGSTDDTYEIACSLSNDKIHVFQSEKGVSNARNLGIEKAKGDWIVFLDADDEILPGSLGSMKQDLDNETALISYRYEHNATSGKLTAFNGTEEISSYLIECLQDPTQRGNSTAVLFNKRFLLDNDLRFDQDLSHAEDSLFLMKAISKANCVKDRELSIYRVIPNENSAVRNISDLAMESYCRSIRAVGRILESRTKEIDNAFCVFAISQLLVILVNGVYASNPFGASVKKTKELCSRDLFKDVLERVDVSGLPMSRKVTMTLLKKHMYIAVGIIIKIRVKQNEK
ncbi:Glycosyl transferase family 2 [Ruminococcaceae bacterium KH2T8]|nr:Glycosyl transferase family 2 [Ruminococcaceae bacterium KH2T8]